MRLDAPRGRTPSTLLAVLTLILTLTFAPETGARAQGENMAPTGHVNQFERLGDFEPRYNQHDTLYSAQVTDPEGGPLTYTWTATIECGTFFPNAPAAHEAVWSHNHDPAPQGCGSHDRPENDSFHDGVVELTVRDDAGNQLKCTINGSVGGGSLPCGPPPQDCTIDLRLYDGQGGARPSDATEESRGAFTVFNANDSDADKTIDFRQNVVRGEDDLMRLRLSPPKPDSGGEVSLRALTANRKFAIYDDADKRTRLAHDPELTIPTSRLPLTLWVEGRRPSDDIRDITLRYAYDPPGADPPCHDDAKATIVWAEPSGVRSDRLDRVWADLPDPPRGAYERSCNGLGLRPRGARPRGVRSCIAFRFVVRPAAVRHEPTVVFDVARQRQSKFLVVAADGGRELQSQDSRFPRGDAANDDKHDNDESQGLDARGRLYSFDGPGVSDWSNPYPTQVRVRYDGRFREYVRVRFNGVRATGNNAAGTVASPKVLWAARYTLRSNAGVLERTTGDRRSSEENFITRR